MPPSELPLLDTRQMLADGTRHPRQPEHPIPTTPAAAAPYGSGTATTTSKTITGKRSAKRID